MGQIQPVSVGQVFDLYNQLNEADKAVLKQLLSIGPDGVTGAVPTGYTRDPQTGRVYKVQQPMAATAEKTRLEQERSDAAKAVKASALQHGITVNQLDGNTIYSPSTTRIVRTSHEALLERLKTAKEAVAAHKAAHPTEWGPATRAGRGGRSRGRLGRGNAPVRGNAVGSGSS
jgi:hypothetical protein